jgi:hypothetical protein
MLRYFVAFGLACATLAGPAAAQGGREWRHEASGVSLPREIGEMRIGQVQDASGGGNWDVIAQLGNGDTPVTLYVYRSAFPNPALWFERTRLAMNDHVGAGARDAAPRSFTLAGAPAPNGLREEIALPGGRATGVAIAQIGEWMVKLRITSNRLDVAGVTARMDQLLGALRFARPATSSLPLTVPGPCEGGLPMRGEQVRNVTPELLAGAAVFGVVGDAEARGHSGLAADPASWCRVVATQLPARFGSLYRRRDSTAWVALLGDSGRSASSMASDLPGRAQAYVFASSPASTQIVAVYDTVPDPDAAVPAAIPVVVGQARGLVEVGAERGRGGRQRKN